MSLRLESSVDYLELSVDGLEPSVNYFELNQDYLEFARRCLHFQKLQIEPRQNSLELGRNSPQLSRNNLEHERNSLDTSRFKIELARYHPVAWRFKSQCRDYKQANGNFFGALAFHEDNSRGGTLRLPHGRKMAGASTRRSESAPLRSGEISPNPQRAIEL